MWQEYLGFILRAATLLVVIFLILALVSAAVQRARVQPRHGRLHVEDLGESYRSLRRRMRDSLLTERKARKRLHKSEKKQRKADKRARGDKENEQANAYVLDFKGDVQASQVEALREAVTAVLSVARAGDTVLVRLESPGGVVHGYGLAASQLARIKEAGLTLWVAVDKVAASGGYMMAAVADRIHAAPFAIVGSIGVVAQLPNINRLLKRLDVDVELHTAGEFKRTLTVLGENTDEGRKKFQEDLEDTHQLFKRHVRAARPALDVEAVANGDYWYGLEALESGLIDEVTTSDDLIRQVLDGPFERVMAVRYEPVRPLAQRLGEGVMLGAEKVFDRFLTRNSPLEK